jgi:hypothetical protein
MLPDGARTRLARERPHRVTLQGNLDGFHEPAYNPTPQHLRAPAVRRSSLDISVYQPPRAASAPEIDGSPKGGGRTWPARRWVASSVAAAVSVGLHAVLVTSIMWGAGPQTKPSQPHGPGALDVAASEAADDGALQVMFIEEPTSSASSTVRRTSKAAPFPKLQPVPLMDPLADLSFQVPEISAADSSRSANSSEDAAARSAMYGRYLGQISARINRAWLRPRSAIGASMFSCRVRIDQDNRGSVQDVTLEDCNGDTRWQLSLVQAIESASPLPAPPDPAVFTHIVHANFEARAYEHGVPQAQYEPESLAEQAALAAKPRENEKVLSAFGDALHKGAPNRVISLTLSGPATPRSPNAPPPPNLGPGSDASRPETPPARSPGESDP